MLMLLSNIQALDIWRQTMVSSVRQSAPDLSARQMALLLNVYLLPPPHTVRGLATQLRISKPAVTRAVDRLVEFGMLCREADERDRRSVLIKCTPAGSDFLQQFGETIVEAVDGVAGQLPSAAACR